MILVSFIFVCTYEFQIVLLKPDLVSRNLKNNNANLIIFLLGKSYKNIWSDKFNRLTLFFFTNLFHGWYIDHMTFPKEIKYLSNLVRTYLQPHYGNGVFGKVYLSAGQH